MPANGRWDLIRRLKVKCSCKLTTVNHRSTMSVPRTIGDPHNFILTHSVHYCLAWCWSSILVTVNSKTITLNTHYPSKLHKMSHQMSFEIRLKSSHVLIPDFFSRSDNANYITVTSLRFVHFQDGTVLCESLKPCHMLPVCHWNGFVIASSHFTQHSHVFNQFLTFICHLHDITMPFRIQQHSVSCETCAALKVCEHPSLWQKERSSQIHVIVSVRCSRKTNFVSAADKLSDR